VLVKEGLTQVVDVQDENERLSRRVVDTTPTDSKLLRAQEKR
jgi:hypothetical protein